MPIYLVNIPESGFLRIHRSHGEALLPVDKDSELNWDNKYFYFMKQI